MRDSDLNNYYLMLGVPSDASLQDIDHAYTRLTQKYKQLLRTGVGFAGEKQKAEIDFELITVAYNALVDDKGRARYDELLPDSNREEWAKKNEEDVKNFCNWHGGEQTDNSKICEWSPEPKRPSLNQPIQKVVESYRVTDPEILRPVSHMIRRQNSGFINRIRRFFGI